MPNKNRTIQTRRDALKWVGAAATSVLFLPLIGCETSGEDENSADANLKMDLSFSRTYPFVLPDLPYSVDALSNVIDAQTMEIHHGKHHQGYTTKLNAALEEYTEFQSHDLMSLLAGLDTLPVAVRDAIRNNGGGYLNHGLFWEMLSPEGGGSPSGELGNGITETFGSFEAFKTEFSETASSVFGSGWAWLTKSKDGELEIVQTANQDTPVTSGATPVLGLDVWEHAYYLRYQNRRADYVAGFWDIINWKTCEQLFTS